MKRTDHPARRLRSTPAPVVTKQMVLSNFTCDFGEVVSGQSRKRVVTFTNTGVVAASLDIGRKALQSSFFSITPDRVKSLPPGESVDLVFSIQTRAKRGNQGMVNTIVPISIRDGPSVEVLLQAHVTVPDVLFSQDKLVFGHVVCGLCKVVTVQLHNPSPVVAQWSYTPYGTSGGRYTSGTPFRVVPDSGSLAAGGRVNIEVTFAPTDEGSFKAELPFRITHNSSFRTLSVRGSGDVLRLEASTSKLVLGPVLPTAVEPELGEVELTNPTMHSLEFYSLDFDSLYHQEVEILRHAQGWDPDSDTMLLPPRKAGESLHPTLLAAERARRVAEGLPPLDTVEAIDLDSNEKATALPHDNSINVIVHGLSGAGVTTAVNSLIESHGLTLMNLDHIVDSALSAVPPSVEDENEDERPGTVPEDVDPLAKWSRDRLQSGQNLPLEAIAGLAWTAIRSPAHARGSVWDSLNSKYAASMVATVTAIRLACCASTRPVPPEVQLPTEEEQEAPVVSMPPTTVRGLIKSKSKITSTGLNTARSAVTLVTAFEEAASPPQPTAKRCWLVDVNVDTDTARLRIETMRQEEENRIREAEEAKQREIDEAVAAAATQEAEILRLETEFQELSEDEYDALDVDARDEYDRRVLQIRRQRRQEKLAKVVAEDEARRLAETKSKDDDKKARRRRNAKDKGDNAPLTPGGSALPSPGGNVPQDDEPVLEHGDSAMNVTKDKRGRPLKGRGKKGALSPTGDSVDPWQADANVYLAGVDAAVAMFSSQSDAPMQKEGKAKKKSRDNGSDGAATALALANLPPGLAFAVSVDGSADCDSVFAEILEALPEPVAEIDSDEGALAIPPPVLLQVLHMPASTNPKQSDKVRRFQLVAPRPPSPEPQEAPVVTSRGHSSGHAAAVVPPVEPEVMKPPTRWVLGPKESVKLNISFQVCGVANFPSSSNYGMILVYFFV